MKRTEPLRSTGVHRLPIVVSLLMGAPLAGLCSLTLLAVEQGSAAQGGTDNQTTAPEGMV